MLTLAEIMETIKMVQEENLDIRTVTMGINLLDCADHDPAIAQQKIYHKITSRAKNIVTVGNDLAREYGIPIVNKRIAVTPISLVAGCAPEADYTDFALCLDKAASAVGVNFIGGFTALVHKGFTASDEKLIYSIPAALKQTERVCASVNVATTKAGINMDAVYLMGKIIKQTAQATAAQNGLGCAKLVVFCNIPEDNPFMAGAIHGVGEPECTINVGISGPGVVKSVVEKNKKCDLGVLAEIVKKTAFKITRMGELIGRLAADRLGVPFGIVDISLAPTPAVGDSVAEILEAMGLERFGTHGTTVALALLTDALKKGGAMASSYVGGLSGTFIPVSEDACLAKAAAEGALSLDKLEALTGVCSVGLDMIAVPGDTSPETIAAIIADEISMGVINRKSTAVRIIPVPGKKVGDYVEFGGLLGRAPVMSVHRFSSHEFICRGGRIPAPLCSLGN
jgi:hypothetical protein